MQYIPFGNRLLLKHIGTEVKKGIVVPQSINQEEKAIGEVVAIGDDVNLSIKVGERVIYDEFSGSYIPGEEDLLIIEAANILAKIYV